MANRHMKRCSIKIIIGEMQIKTIMRYYLRMAIINKCTGNMLERIWRKGNSSTLLVEM